MPVDVLIRVGRWRQVPLRWWPVPLRWQRRLRARPAVAAWGRPSGRRL